MANQETPDPAGASAARDAADSARDETRGAWKEQEIRAEKAKRDYRRFDAAADQAYEKARQKSPLLSIGAFNKATKNWQKAGEVQLSPPPLSPATELASVRSVAKEWLAASMALFGLFSFTALFFGSETLGVLDNQSKQSIIVFIALLVTAVGAATACNYFGTRAAHGWPRGRNPRSRSTELKIQQARRDLKWAMAFALATVLAILAALALIITPLLNDPTPLIVQVLAPGEIENVLVCGEYKSAGANGISVTNEDGGLVTTRWGEVGKVNAVRSCGSS
ncbi:UNVERIFIED_CONTAM: hypothetical protein RF653_10070 [Kocuria sp. CPCC 205316]|uniref:hypothetical protein n=1 Tax=Kocuria TaxID=57493 RepID=UPI0036D97CC0